LQDYNRKSGGCGSPAHQRIDATLSRSRFANAMLKSVFQMKLNSNTTVARVLAALPSSAAVFDGFAIRTDHPAETTLETVCTNSGVHVEEFLRALDEIDWNYELTDDASP
jgi:hypothetical protein